MFPLFPAFHADSIPTRSREVQRSPHLGVSWMAAHNHHIHPSHVLFSPPNPRWHVIIPFHAPVHLTALSRVPGVGSFWVQSGHTFPQFQLMSTPANLITPRRTKQHVSVLSVPCRWRLTLIFLGWQILVKGRSPASCSSFRHFCLSEPVLAILHPSNNTCTFNNHISNLQNAIEV